MSEDVETECDLTSAFFKQKAVFCSDVFFVVLKLMQQFNICELN